MKRMILSALLLAAIFSSCKKEKHDSGPDPSCQPNVASISGTYTLTDVRLYSESNEIENLYEKIKDCEKDDLHILNSDGSYIVQDAGDTCDADRTTSAWSLDGEKLKIDSNEYTIEEFDCNTLIVKRKVGETQNEISKTYTRHDPDPDSSSSCQSDAASISGTYKLTDVNMLDSASNKTENVYSYIKDCEKDDLFILNIDGSYIVEDAGDTCGTRTPPSTWSLDGEKLKIGSNEYTIEEFDCNTLIIKRKVGETQNEISKTYTRQ